MSIYIISTKYVYYIIMNIFWKPNDVVSMLINEQHKHTQTPKIHYIHLKNITNNLINCPLLDIYSILSFMMIDGDNP